jgi:hypothetical protein
MNHGEAALDILRHSITLAWSTGTFSRSCIASAFVSTAAGKR